MSCPPVRLHLLQRGWLSACAQVCQSREEDSKEALSAILGGKPLLAVAFDGMEMVVEEPEIFRAASAARCANEQQRIFA